MKRWNQAFIESENKCQIFCPDFLYTCSFLPNNSSGHDLPTPWAIIRHGRFLTVSNFYPREDKLGLNLRKILGWELLFFNPVMLSVEPQSHTYTPLQDNQHCHWLSHSTIWKVFSGLPTQISTLLLRLNKATHCFFQLTYALPCFLVWFGHRKMTSYRKRTIQVFKNHFNQNRPSLNFGRPTVGRSILWAKKE